MHDSVATITSEVNHCRLNRISLSLMLPGFLFLILIPMITEAQSNADCLSCHSDSSLTMQRKGKQIFIYINNDSYAGSSHGELKCVACHEGHRTDEIPHSEHPYSVSCLNCHRQSEDRHLFHPSLVQSIQKNKISEIECLKCHHPHYTLSSKALRPLSYEKRMTESCRGCHSDVFEQHNVSAHGQTVSAKITGAPNCLSCHRYEVSGVSGKVYSVELKREQGKMCLTCHIVWHMYFVIFNPDVYPLNVAFWKGTLTEVEMLNEHPLELEEIKNKTASAEGNKLSVMKNNINKEFASQKK